MRPTERDLIRTQEALQGWLRERWAGVESLEVGSLAKAEDGMSGELLMFDVTYVDQGQHRSEGMVVRLEPCEEHQLFLDTAFEEQFRAMEMLARHSKAPVPRAVGFEPDREMLGNRFYVMSKAEGRTGALWLEWMTALDPVSLERTWWSGLEAMAELHRVEPVQAGLDFLDQPARGADPIDQMLHYNQEFYDWVRDGETRPVIEAAASWLRANKPATLPPSGFVWGDAKRGNLLFDDDLACSAVLDFEMMSLGPAEMDLAYWMEGEYQTAEMMGMPSPTVEETIERYSQLLGRRVEDLDYYTVLAAYRIAVLRVKLWVLRAGEENRGDRYDGDRRLALVLERHADVDVAVD